MSLIPLCREAVRETLDQLQRDPNVGLLLRRGMTAYDEGVSDSDGGKAKGGQNKQALLEKISQTPTSEIYTLAYTRWQQATSDSDRFATFKADLIGRLYIGVNRDSALETGLTVNHTYGMPMIPGSAVKGLARACATQWMEGQDDAIAFLFGSATSDADGPDANEAGGVVFHDAWWIPDTAAPRPFASEIITSHHSEYYGSEGQHDASDFDSPIPAPQLAIQGSFLFAIEGAAGWTGLATKILKHGLALRGIGAKRSSGYGFFDLNE